MTPSVVVFDIGGVLVDWQPHLAWLDEMGSRAMVDAFMRRIDFPALNLRADGGETFADLAAELTEAEDACRLSGYVAHYPKTVRTRIEGTWDILDRLRAQGTPVHAITNWSAETWPKGLEAQPRLAEVFGTTIVSGQEKTLKPGPRIFELLCERAGVAPEDCLFIDDAAHNAEGARAAGMDAHHFTTAQALHKALTERGLL
ncbi:HAD family hydrolase [Rhodalgimonas zhirmunskyi]|uniref:HAD family phosphatase n=1 Tax=Rhodalgimonas zhirmunskyi TaxID=2964767 RepID=A0AAJ1UE90_9RHOB|nr:HAD family phosphatase [Rhodoalgimonas zhirmunskyi]MDQ2094457.1 HAD family phosphatase [Rhodoalgimonas zhirmunskyi]